MKLYSYYQSSASYRVRIALALKDIVPDMAYINLTRNEQKSPGYYAINPQMIVPTLIDEERRFGQSLAILEYIEEKYPTPALLPQDVKTRAYVRELALIIGADTSPLGNLKVRKYLENEMKQDKDIIERWTRHWIHEGLTAFEATLSASGYHGSFCYDNTPTIADCCLMPQLFNAQRFGCDLTPYPIIRKIMAICDAHPAFISAHPTNQGDMPK